MALVQVRDMESVEGGAVKGDELKAVALEDVVMKAAVVLIVGLTNSDARVLVEVSDWDRPLSVELARGILVAFKFLIELSLFTVYDVVRFIDPIVGQLSENLELNALIKPTLLVTVEDTAVLTEVTGGKPLVYFVPWVKKSL